MHLRVLVADDNLLFAEALTQLLEADERIQVVGCAYNGAEAVDFARKLEPDVVLTDIKMPLMTGIEATHRILAFNPETTVVLMSAHSSPSEAEEGLRAGASGYVTKDDLGLWLVETVLAHAAAKRRELAARFSDLRLPSVSGRLAASA
jgi:two-component system, NarL family, response regulator DegU